MHVGNVRSVLYESFVFLVFRFRMVSSPGPVLSFIVWLLCGPLHWCLWALLAYSLLYGVKHAYFATKQWIADNTVYEWKDGGTLKKAA